MYNYTISFPTRTAGKALELSLQDSKNIIQVLKKSHGHTHGQTDTLIDRLTEQTNTRKDVQTGRRTGEPIEYKCSIPSTNISRDGANKLSFYHTHALMLQEMRRKP